MNDSAGFALHRPELAQSLLRGEQKIRALMYKSIRQCGPNETLISANTQHNYVYRVRQGWAGRTRQLEDGRAQIILIYLPGDLFAVKSMFTTRHPDAVQTISNAVLEQIDHRRVHDGYASDPDIALRCTWQILEEERRLRSWITSLGQGDAEERIAMLLIEFRGRLAISSGAGDSLVEYEMPLTHEQLGDHLGISSVHVNRVVKSFGEHGIVTIRGRQVILHDVEALARIAHPLLDAYERATAEYSGTPPSQS